MCVWLGRTDEEENTADFSLALNVIEFVVPRIERFKMCFNVMGTKSLTNELFIFKCHNLVRLAFTNATHHNFRRVKYACILLLYET